MSFALNQISVSGNLTRDPDTRQAGGTSVTSFSIAHNHRVKDKQTDQWVDKPSFFDAVIFGAQGEWLAKTAVKGDPVVIGGALEQQRWQDKATGDNRSKVQIVARDVVLGQRVGDRQSNEPTTRSETPAYAGQSGADDYLPYS